MRLTAVLQWQYGYYWPVWSPFTDIRLTRTASEGHDAACHVPIYHQAPYEKAGYEFQIATGMPVILDNTLSLTGRFQCWNGRSLESGELQELAVSRLTGTPH